MGAISAELRNVLKSVTKYTDNTANGGGSVSSHVTSTADYFFLLAEYEVFGSVTGANTYEANYQQQYAYYATGNSKVKFQHNVERSAFWWLRSPRADDIYVFMDVLPAGKASSYLATFFLGFAPAFCV